MLGSTPEDLEQLSRESLVSASAALLDQLAARNVAIADLQRTLNRLSTELEAALAQRSLLTLDLGKLLAERARLASELEAVGGHRDQLSAAHDQLAALRDELAAQLTAERQLVEQLKQENRDLSKALAAELTTPHKWVQLAQRACRFVVLLLSPSRWLKWYRERSP